MGKRRILWIGGSSQLARTYYSVHGRNLGGKDDDDVLFLSGFEPCSPFPIHSKNVSYHPLDLTKIDEETDLPESMQEVLKQGITSIIVSIRPVLMTSMNNNEARDYNQRMLDGLDVLLNEVMATGSVRHVVHISSVAAVDHLKSQVNHCEDDDIDYKSMRDGSMTDDDSTVVTSYNNMAPYDVFKLDTEDLIGRVCSNKVLYTNLRVSGLLFEEGRCIVSQSFLLQARLGVYIQSKVDMNPARNVCAAIRLILSKMESMLLQGEKVSGSTTSDNKVVVPSLEERYYYTRPTHVIHPIYLYEVTYQYQKAYDLSWYSCFFTPYCLYVAFIYILSQITVLLGSILPYAHATDYLLRVSLLDHSFDNTRFLRDFPEIHEQEITVEECFRNRRHRRLKLCAISKKEV